MSHPWPLIAFLGKQAAAVGRVTLNTKSIPAKDAAAVSEALHADHKPASHVAPTRYGRTPYKRKAKE